MSIIKVTEEKIIRISDKAKDGEAATIAVGTVTALPANASPLVENVGTENAAIFNFGIPIGVSDQTAPPTEGTAATINVGTVTALPANATPIVENVGTENAAIFNFAIPEGEKGEKGDDGAQGIQGIQGEKGDDGAQGIQGIQGEKGDDGAQGIQGIQGEKGDDGEAATIAIGTVTELDSEATPTVTNSGTANDAVLDFGLPAAKESTSSAPVDSEALDLKVDKVNAIDETIIEDEAPGFYFRGKDDDLVAKIDADGLQSIKFKDKEGKEIKAEQKKLQDKFVVSIGDSHSTAWLPKFTELTGSTFDSTLQMYIKDNQPNYADTGKTLGEAKALKQYVTDNSIDVDVITIENVHFSKDGVIDDWIPQNFKHVQTYGTTYASWTSLLANISVDKAAFITSLTPTLNTAIKFLYNSFKDTIQFSSSGVLTAGTATLNINGNDFPIVISEGDTLVEAITALNDWAFGEYVTDWNNLDTKGATRSDGSIIINYTGASNPPTDPVITFDGGTTGLVMDSTVVSTAVASFNYYFNSLDLSKWNDDSYWNSANGNRVYPEMMGLIEYLQETFPTAEIIVWAVQWLSVSDNPLDASSFLVETYAGSGEYVVDMQAYLNDTKVINYKEVKWAMKEVADRYNCRFIDVDANCGISIHNMFSGEYYPPNSLHPLTKGYEQWALTFTKLI